MREIRLNFYEVHRCGYYRRGESDPEFGDFPDTVQHLHAWVSGNQLSVRQTQTFSPGPDSDFLPVFSYNLTHHQQSGDYLITTWNETEVAEDRMASVRANEPTGTARIDTTNVPTNSLPGYPAYFWVIPDRKLIGVIRLEGQRLGGHPGLVRYMRGYLERMAPWVVYPSGVTPAPDEQVLGYAEPGDNPDDFYPRFESSPVRLGGELDFIRANGNRIRKVIRKDKYEGGVADRRLLGRMLQRLGVHTDTPRLDDTRFKYELDYAPDTDELEEIIAAWEERSSSGEESNWDDVGFRFVGEQETRWLSQSTAKQALDVDISLRDEVLIEPQTLLQELNSHRNDLLRSI